MPILGLVQVAGHLRPIQPAIAKDSDPVSLKQVGHRPCQLYNISSPLCPTPDLWCACRPPTSSAPRVLTTPSARWSDTTFGFRSARRPWQRCLSPLPRIPCHCLCWVTEMWRCGPCGRAASGATHVAFDGICPFKRSLRGSRTLQGNADRVGRAWLRGFAGAGAVSAKFGPGVWLRSKVRLACVCGLGISTRETARLLQDNRNRGYHQAMLATFINASRLGLERVMVVEENVLLRLVGCVLWPAPARGGLSDVGGPAAVISERTCGNCSAARGAAVICSRTRRGASCCWGQN
jgi:hypothetical protein